MAGGPPGDRRGAGAVRIDLGSRDVREVFRLWAIVLFLTGMKAFLDSSHGWNPNPYIDWSGGEARLVLPPLMRWRLDRSNMKYLGRSYRMKDFAPEVLAQSNIPQTSSTAPFAVIADFDQNGMPDVALLEHSPYGTRLVVILAKRVGASVLVLLDTFGPNRWNHLDRVALAPVPPGELRYRTSTDANSFGTLTVLAPSFRLHRDARRSDVYRWHEGKFIGVTTYD
jgi:hypothetical protein